MGKLALKGGTQMLGMPTESKDHYIVNVDRRSGKMDPSTEARMQNLSRSTVVKVT